MAIRLGFTPLLAFLALAASPQNATDPAGKWRTEEAPKGLAQIDASVRLRFDTSGNADRVMVNVVLRNTSDTAIFFTEQSPDWDYQLDVTGPDGQSQAELTNYGKCVLPHPSAIFRNISRTLQPGETDHVESVELNRLFRLDSVGLYRIVVRRRIWSKAPSEGLLVSSDPAAFALTTPQADSSPPGFDPQRCR